MLLSGTGWKDEACKPGQTVVRTGTPDCATITSWRTDASRRYSLSRTSTTKTKHEEGFTSWSVFGAVVLTKLNQMISTGRREMVTLALVRSDFGLLC